MLDRIMLSSGASESSWYAYFNIGATVSASSVSVDTAKNVYATNNFSSGGLRIYTEKMNNTPVTQWGKGLAASVSETYATDNCIDSSGNVYVCGQNLYSPGIWFNPEADPPWEPYYSWQMVIAKYNSSGVLQWKNYYAKPPTDPPNNGDDRPYAIDVDGSGNVYVGGSGSGGAVILKYNSSGTLQWQTILVNGAYISGLAVNSSGDIHVCTNNGYVAKLTTSASITWQKQISAGLTFGGLALSSSGDVIVCATGSFVAKFNSSGTLQWQTAVTAGDVYRVSVDASGNVYTGGYIRSNFPYGNATLFKFNSSGTLQWQRILRRSDTTSTNETIREVVPDNVGNIYIAGTAYGSFVMKVPDDGTKTGTFSIPSTAVTLSYEASSFAVTTPTYTVSTPSLSPFNPSFNYGASPMTDQTFTLGIGVVQL